jgi:hypothetical protein
MANSGALLHPSQVLVCFVYLGFLVYLVERNQADEPNKQNKPNQPVFSLNPFRLSP